VCPPPPNTAGNWQEEIIGNGIKACYYSTNQISGNKLRGFALTGDANTEKQKLVKRMEEDAKAG